VETYDLNKSDPVTAEQVWRRTSEHKGNFSIWKEESEKKEELKCTMSGPVCSQSHVRCGAYIHELHAD